MKSIVFLFTLFSFTAFSQKTDKVIIGQITDCSNKTPIANATVKLLCQNGDIYSTISDSFGHYFFDHAKVKPNLSYALSVNAPIENGDKNIVYGKCPYSYQRKGGYLNSSEKIKFKTDSILTIKRADFCLIEMLRCELIIPTIYFNNNSIEFSTTNIDYSNYEMQGDTALDCYITLLLNNPEFVIELSGHSNYSEKDPKALSEIRVMLCKDYMVSKGIHPDRIKTKGYGAERPIEVDIDKDGRPNYVLTKKTIKKLSKGKSKEEIEALMQKNRRVVVSILSKDFVDPDKAAPKTAPKQLNEEEE